MAQHKFLYFVALSKYFFFNITTSYFDINLHTHQIGYSPIHLAIYFLIISPQEMQYSHQDERGLESIRNILITRQNNERIRITIEKITTGMEIKYLKIKFDLGARSQKGVLRAKRAIKESFSIEFRLSNDSKHSVLIFFLN